MIPRADDDDDFCRVDLTPPNRAAACRGVAIEMFARLLSLDDAAVMQNAVVVMAEALTVGSELVEAASVQLGARKPRPPAGR